MDHLGEMFRITSWGESHGKAVGVVIEGCPAGLALTETDITAYLAAKDRPIPELATGRAEPNEVEILSGTARGITLGTPLCLMIPNRDIRPQDYRPQATLFRPGHGDYTYHLKYGRTAPSGGGRASGRECIARLAAGHVALAILRSTVPGLRLESRILSLAGVPVTDRPSLENAVARARAAAEQGDSTGGQIEVRTIGIPSGLGEPVFAGLDALVAGALMGIGAVKAVEIGTRPEDHLGSDYNDWFAKEAEGLTFRTNNAGGVLSGVSNGQDLVVRLSVKPTPSMARVAIGATNAGNVQPVSVNGRHDLNITPRIGPIAEAMIALILVDLLMLSGRLAKDRLP